MDNIHFRCLKNYFCFIFLFCYIVKNAYYNYTFETDRFIFFNLNASYVDHFLSFIHLKMCLYVFLGHMATEWCGYENYPLE